MPPLIQNGKVPVAIAVRLVQDDAEREAVYRLRYTVYVEELGRKQSHADEANRRIAEPIDRSARIFAAFDGPQIVGTIRQNWASDDIAPYPRFYHFHLFKGLPKRIVSISSKLIVAPSHRGSTLSLRLCTAVFDFVARNGGQFSIMDCSTPHKPFFEKLGFRQYLPDLPHPIYGTLHRMALCVHDREHLQRVGSPYWRVIQNIPHNQSAVELFHQRVLPGIRASLPPENPAPSS